MDVSQRYRAAPWAPAPEAAAPPPRRVVRKLRALRRSIKILLGAYFLILLGLLWAPLAARRIIVAHGALREARVSRIYSQTDGARPIPFVEMIAVTFALPGGSTAYHVMMIPKAAAAALKPDAPLKVRVLDAPSSLAPDRPFSSTWALSRSIVLWMLGHGLPAADGYPPERSFAALDDDMGFSRLYLRAALGFTFIFSVAAFLNAWLRRRTERLLKRGIAVKGLVLSARRDGLFTSAAVIYYEHAGAALRRTFRRVPGRLEPDRAVTVIVDPRRPRRAVIYPCRGHRIAPAGI